MTGPVVVGDAPATPEDLYWRAAAAKMRSEELSNPRARAEKWATAMASLIALVSVSTLLAGRDALQKIDETWRLAIMVLAVLAVVAAAVATYFGARASQG